MNSSEIFKALSDETRLRILRILAEHELSVNEIVDILDVTQSRVSRHLTTLRSVGFLASRREGTWVYYRKPSQRSMKPEILQVWNLVLRWDAKDSQQVKDQKKLQQVLQRKAERSLEFYGEHAQRWDHIRSTLCGEYVTTQAMESLIPKTLTVADIGTGTGELLLPLARIVQHVIGIDPSTEMMKQAKFKADQVEVNNIEFRTGKMEDLPLQDHEVDATFAGLALHHSTDPALALREMSRVVKPNGTVTIIDFQSHNEEWMREELAHTWLGFSREDLEQWYSNAGLIDFTWIEGFPHPEKEKTDSRRIPVKSFVCYGRKN
jgi:ArsR family transcriptional regulator